MKIIKPSYEILTPVKTEMACTEVLSIKLIGDSELVNKFNMYAPFIERHPKDEEMTVVVPYCYSNADKEEQSFTDWVNCCESIESVYLDMLGRDSTKNEAEKILPNCTKVCVTINLGVKYWKKLLNELTEQSEYPQTQNIAKKIKQELRERMPNTFR